MHNGKKGNPTQEPNHCTGQGAVETFFAKMRLHGKMEDAMKQAYQIFFTSIPTRSIDR
jgi:hypothetical protein